MTALMYMSKSAVATTMMPKSNEAEQDLEKLLISIKKGIAGLQRRRRPFRGRHSYDQVTGYVVGGRRPPYPERRLQWVLHRLSRFRTIPKAKS